MQKSCQIIFACLVSLFSLSYSSSSTLSAETISAHCRDFPPDLYFDGENCVGIVPDFVSDVFDELGYKIKWKKVPWARTISDAKKGRVDLLIRHSMTAERKGFLLPVIYANTRRNLSFYKSPHLRQKVESYDDIAKLKVGSILGFYYSPKFSKLESEKVVFVGKTEQLIGMLKLGRIDLAVTSESHSEELFKDSFEKANFVDSFDNQLYISIPKKSPLAHLHSELAAAVARLKDNGSIAKYYHRYNAKAPDYDRLEASK